MSTSKLTTSKTSSIKMPGHTKQKQVHTSGDNSVSTAGNSDSTQDVTTAATKISSQSQSILFKVSPEVLQSILEYAIYVDGDISPQQVKERSNKFIWSTAQIVDGKICISKAPELTAVALSKVCHRLYDSVALGHMLYKQSAFKFYCVNDMLSYLAAITCERKAAIRSINCPYLITPYRYHFLFCREAYHMLLLGTGLEELSIQVLQSKISSSHGTPAEQINTHNVGLNELLFASQHIKKISIKSVKNEDAPLYRQKDPDLIGDVSKMYLDHMAAEVAKLRKTPLTVSKPTLNKYVRKAIEAAKLDIDGEGRVNGDRKPNIASRTRRQIKVFADVDEDGILPTQVESKYDLSGDYCWYFIEVRNSRKSDDDVFPLDFLVYGCSGRMSRKSTISEESWENIGVLNSGGALSTIATYYSNNPNAIGKYEARNYYKQAFKTVIAEETLDGRWEQQRKINALKYFDSVIRRQEKEFARAQKAMARATAQKERAEAKASRGQSPKHKVLIELSSDSSPDEDSENESNDEEGPGDEDDLDAE